MAEYVQINILDMLESLGEDECNKILSSFVCPLNMLEIRLYNLLNSV